MNIQFKSGGGMEVLDNVFNAPYNESLVHQVVTSFLSSSRSGTKAQKTRSEVSGGGVKPWKQKGTGRARAGTIRSPLWRKGGITFAAKPRSFEKKINRKVYRAALCSIFSELNRLSRLNFVESFSVDSPRTKDFVSKVKELNVGDSVLLILGEVELSAYLGSRNLKNVTVIDVKSLDPVLLLQHENVVLDSSSVAKINEWLS